MNLLSDYQSLSLLNFLLGKASIVTGGIDHFTETGIQMKDGLYVEADFIIVATGLALQQNSPFSTIQGNISKVWTLEPT